MSWLVWTLVGAFVLYCILKVFESVFDIDLHWLTGDDKRPPKDP